MRYANASVMRSRGLLAFFILCFFPVLVFAVLIYLSHSTAVSSLFRTTRSPIQIDAGFFNNFLGVQASFCYLLTAIIGPGLVSPDLTNNALVLYLCRPFTRWEYVLGKIAAIARLLSLITWIPGLLLFTIQASLAGWAWTWDNLYIAGAIVLTSLVLILIMSLLALALSAWVRWKPVAGALVIGTIFIGSGFAAAVKVIARSDSGSLLAIPALFQTVCEQLFRLNRSSPIAPAEGWAAFLAISVALLWLLARKLRAYQVVN
jgi:ABC-2 type transport system permease protein